MRDQSTPTPNAIVVGFGPVGRLVTEQLEADGYAVTLIERNTTAVNIQLALSRSVVAGHAEEDNILIEAGIHSANTIVITIPDEQAALNICRAARALNASIFIAARANHMSHGLLCQQAGADHVTIEELAAAKDMSAAIHDRIALSRKAKSKRRVG